MKRRIIKVDDVGMSTTNDKYVKYQFHIQEKNGDISIIPAYGKDLENAIKGFKQRESLIKQQKLFSKIPVNAFVFIAFGIMLFGAYFVNMLDKTWLTGLTFLVTIGFIGWLSTRIK
jgi:hypothetical protein